jgi:hypothetical protein
LKKITPVHALRKISTRAIDGPIAAIGHYQSGTWRNNSLSIVAMHSAKVDDSLSVQSVVGLDFPIMAILAILQFGPVALESVYDGLLAKEQW